MVARANGSDYGLAAGVWTSDLLARLPVRRRGSRPACVWVNTWFDVAVGQPLGGVKESGYGRELSAETLLEYSAPKAISMRISNARPDLWS